MKLTSLLENHRKVLLRDWGVNPSTNLTLERQQTIVIDLVRLGEISRKGLVRKPNNEPTIPLFFILGWVQQLIYLP